MTRKPAMSAAEYAENTRDELKQIELHPHDLGSLSLDAMRAMPRDDARAIWAQASDADKRGLAIQCIRHGNHGPDEATIALYLDLLEGQLGSDMAIPARDELLAVVKERHDTAMDHEDYAGARQLDRVRVNILNGARLSWHAGDLLIQSINHPGTVYSVSGRGCTCVNGQKGKAECWHVCLHDLLLDMLSDRAAIADDASESEGEPEPEPIALGRRLAEARAKIAA